MTFCGPSLVFVVELFAKNTGAHQIATAVCYGQSKVELKTQECIPFGFLGRGAKQLRSDRNFFSD